MEPSCNLSLLAPGQRARILSIRVDGAIRRRLL